MKSGTFIVLDGIGGSGKSTQMEYLREKLPHAVFTKEPGGAPHAEKIREILKTGGGMTPDPLTDFFLFWAARAEHMGALIRPALEMGKTVITDRFDSSTFAMQVRGDERPDLEEFFWQCRKATLGEHEPDTYIILDIPHAVAKDRREGRRKGEDRFDERDDAYQERVRVGYTEFSERVGGHVIDASRSLDQKHEDIWSIVESLVK